MTTRNLTSDFKKAGTITVGRGLVSRRLISNVYRLMSKFVGTSVLDCPYLISKILKNTSRSVSRVLSRTVIYLDAGLLPALKPLFVTRRAGV